MVDKPSRKSAPQQSVLEIVKTGDWSKVVYLHKLECGHIETRKRAATTKKIACLDCVKAESLQKVLVGLSKPTVIDPPLGDIWTSEIDEDIAQTEQEINVIRAGIANSLSISLEAIDVVMESTEDGVVLSYVMLFLDPETALRISKSIQMKNS